jgi:ADP-dependent NAD(P)H-hydrate dehydratase
MSLPLQSTLPRLPARRPDSNKGDFGRALVVGGSRGMTGAIALSGMAALRGGAGLVRLGVADCCLDTVAAFEPSYMTSPLPCDDKGHISLQAREVLVELAKTATCVACGPGLGQSDDLTELVGWLYANLALPMVLDADALNALAQRPSKLANPAGPRVITPHPKEFSRLSGVSEKERDAQIEAARKLSADHGIVILLKGRHTFITDGRQEALNTTGNPGMATGGTGDVLTGLVTALVCQKLSPFEAAQLGAHLHGLAGDLAAAEVGQVSLIASDLVSYLPDAFRALGDPAV